MWPIYTCLTYLQHLFLTKPFMFTTNQKKTWKSCATCKTRRQFWFHHCPLHTVSSFITLAPYRRRKTSPNMKAVFMSTFAYFGELKQIFTFQTAVCQPFRYDFVCSFTFKVNIHCQLISDGRLLHLDLIADSGGCWCQWTTVVSKVNHWLQGKGRKGEQKLLKTTAKQACTACLCKIYITQMRNEMARIAHFWPWNQCNGETFH